MTEHHYRCWTEIDRAALRHNTALIKKRLGPDIETLAVVKADAYGHGMIAVAKALSNEVQLFGVANLTEAIALRGAVEQPIMLLGPALPQERGLIAEQRFIPSISTWEEADQFNRLASNKKVLINFKIDTGMGRMGVPAHEAIALFKKVNALPHVEIHSVSTHLPVSTRTKLLLVTSCGVSALSSKNCALKLPAIIKCTHCKRRESWSSRTSLSKSFDLACCFMAFRHCRDFKIFSVRR